MYTKKLLRKIERRVTPSPAAGVFLSIGGLLFLSAVITCTTSPTAGSKKDNPISLYLDEKGITQADYFGVDIIGLIDFPDSVECNFDKNISVHSMKVQFLLPEEALTNKKVLSLKLPFYWIEKKSLPFDSSLGVYFDTISLKVGLLRSNTVKVFVKNLPPRIDSLIAGDTSYYVPFGNKKLTVFNCRIKDTMNSDIKLKVVARDLDSPNLSVTWASMDNNKYLVWNSVTNPTMATYKNRPGTFRDIVTVVVSDYTVSAQVTVNLIKLLSNPASIDSITVADTVFNDTAKSSYVYKTIIVDTLKIRGFTHAEGLKGTWKTYKGMYTPNTTLDTNGLAITYVCTLSTKKDTLKIDTLLTVDSLKFTLFNTFGDSTVKKIIICKQPANRKPVIDSVRIDTVTYKNSANNSASVPPGGSTPVKIFAHDPDNSKRALGYLWYGTIQGSLSSTTTDTSTYTALNKLYTDTLFCSVADPVLFKAYTKIVLISNNPPIMDSIAILDTVHDTTFIVGMKKDSLFSCSRKAADTFTVRMYGRELDTALKDTLTSQWRYKNASFKLTTSYAGYIKYISADSTYADTVIVTLSDKQKAQNRRKIIISFTR